ncbi:MAG: carbamoyltransferase C-terminal domain-containing protein [Candidatus Woesearchaeota archaeon]
MGNIIVLGINDGHNAGAALVKNGKVIAAIQEERLRNIKNYSGVPSKAIKAVYRIANIHPDDTDVVSIVSLNRTYSPLKEFPLKVKLFYKLAPYLDSHTFSKWYVKILHKFRKMEDVRKVLKEMRLDQKELMFIEHHQCHAACAHYSKPISANKGNRNKSNKTTSKNKPNLVLTSDGAGDGLSATVSIGHKNRIQRIAATTFYNSLGNVLYSEITGYMGLKRWEHEYKLMGMAPYGKAEYSIDNIRKIIRINPQNPLEFQNRIGAIGPYIGQKLKHILHEHRFDNLSAATQLHFERLVKQWVKNAVKKTGLNNIVCAGGMFLNVKANKILREMPEVDNIFFYPAADDGGTPVGAALEAYHKYCRKRGIKAEHHEIKDVYYGCEYDNDYIKAVLQTTGLHKKEWIKKAKYIDDIDAEVGELIAKNNIVARVSGRTEWGPRALGNRSIIANPSDLRMIKDINFAIKKRDFWMPFAVSLIEKRMNKYLINPIPSRYMIDSFDTTDKRDEIVSGTHPFDNTARPHTVQEWNPSYLKVLEEFEKHTGISGVLNTSFNLHGYPLVDNPEVALFTFENSGLKYLALGNWLIKK